MAPVPEVSLRELLCGLAGTVEFPPIPVHGLCLDSRRVSPGDVFFALPGVAEHGLQHAREALQRGARTIIYDPSGGGALLAEQVGDAPCFPVESLRESVGLIADRFFGHPSREMTIIAVTGTNGKTSATHFLAEALSNHRPGAVIGTLGWGIPGHLHKTTHTTPDAIELQSILAKLRAQGIVSAAIEASSHGLAQARLNGVRVQTALYTNVTRDHLDYHGTAAGYLGAKLRLLHAQGLAAVVFNADDPELSRVLSGTPFPHRRIGFSLSGTSDAPVPLLRATRLEHLPDGLRLAVAYEGHAAILQSSIFGDYNAENLLGALGVLLALGYRLEEGVTRLKRVRAVPGRMERFQTTDGVTAVVDYAHTPDALDRVLRNLRHHCRARLWVVFGCGGERDRGKRPLMGAAAARWADRIIVTDDNPRREDGAAIVAEILAGCQGSGAVVQRDRRLAIAAALSDAKPGDIVLVAGKGHEEVQEVGEARLPFSDRIVIMSLLAAGAVES